MSILGVGARTRPFPHRMQRTLAIVLMDSYAGWHNSDALIAGSWSIPVSLSDGRFG
ncbi:MAG: hypothetical protein NVS2B7_11590 [Herpetosiphon sp.]